MPPDRAMDCPGMKAHSRQEYDYLKIVIPSCLGKGLTGHQAVLASVASTVFAIRWQSTAAGKPQ